MLPVKGSKEGGTGDRPTGRQESSISQGMAGVAEGRQACVHSNKRPSSPANTTSGHTDGLLSFCHFLLLLDKSVSLHDENERPAAADHTGIHTILNTSFRYF